MTRSRSIQTQHISLRSNERLPVDFKISRVESWIVHNLPELGRRLDDITKLVNRPTKTSKEHALVRKVDVPLLNSATTAFNEARALAKESDEANGKDQLKLIMDKAVIDNAHLFVHKAKEILESEWAMEIEKYLKETDTRGDTMDGRSLPERTEDSKAGKTRRSNSNRRTTKRSSRKSKKYHGDSDRYPDFSSSSESSSASSESESDCYLSDEGESRVGRRRMHRRSRARR
ncbi:hypothetical protein BJ508DRAFT_349494 [Ascobolus immersus RN42]|uniref:Uncharacterized protein n=1 Tax=Ascobolus immersus RN42 TaxID=1160509 RepID=A0A3N4HWN4_ASCIM|nr:hypothetical protein BJ508DRAFT_349494 [Ascobolus immersus RN42]